MEQVFQMPGVPRYHLTDPTMPNCGFSNAVHSSLSVCESELSNAFFSPHNVSALQYAIVEDFHSRTGIVTERQRKEDLLCIMRAIFMEHCRNLPNGVEEQLIALNILVTNDCVSKVAIGVEQHLTYLKDASTLPLPLSRGESTSIKGTNPTSNNNIGL